MNSISHKIRTNVYLDKDTKQRAQQIFKTYGMGLSEAFNIFLSQTVLERGLPFQVKIPNEKTLEAMQEVEEGHTLPVSMQEHLDEMKQCIKS